jgi:hypothetical protein
MKIFSRFSVMFNNCYFPPATEFMLESVEDNDAFISWKNKDHNQKGSFILNRKSKDYQRFMSL